MSGGGKGGSQSTSVQIPAWLESAAQQNLARADRVSQLGYTPYFGPDVAALTPMQQAAMQNTNNAALSFGMAAPGDAMAGIPAAQTFAGGLQGYSSAPLYQQSVDALRTNAPGQYNAMREMFIDPITGAAPAYPFSMGGAAPSAMPGPQGFDWAGGGGGGGGGGLNFGGGNGGSGAMRTGGGTGSFGLPDPMSGRFAGTNLPGVAGSVINRVTNAVAPRSTPPAIVRTQAAPKPAAKPAAKSAAPRGGNAGRR